MKKTIRVQTLFSFLICFLTCSLPAAFAQPILTAPSGNTSIYPGVANPNMLPNSCYAVRTVLFTSNYYDLYLSGWSSAPLQGKVIWRRYLPGATTPLDQNEISIPNAMNVEVTLLGNQQGTPYIAAAYYQMNVGYMLTIYQWQVNNFVPFQNIQLSGPTSTYKIKNINLDSYSGHKTAIVWSEDDPLGGTILKCVLGTDITFTAPITLTGTNGADMPDVAVSKNGGNTSSVDYAAHIVYATYNSSGSPTTVTLNEVALPIDQVIALNPTSYTPVFEDANYIGPFTTYTFPVIDCPEVSDFASGFANWAYVYQSAAGVEMRITHISQGVPPTTHNLVDGSYGNYNIFAPFGYNANSRPTLTYGQNGTTLFAGWMFNGYPNTSQSRLATVEISADGNSLVSAPDYLLISNNPQAAYPHFSKNTMYCYYLYTTFIQNNNALTHMLHQWGSPSFKNGPGTDNNITIYPVPFKNDIHVTVSSALMDESLDVWMTDITGKTVFSGSCSGKTLENVLQSKCGTLPAGAYLLNAGSKKLGYSQQLKLVKAG